MADYRKKFEELCEAVRADRFCGMGLDEFCITRRNDCLLHSVNINDYTTNTGIMFTDAGIPLMLKGIPGKYIWICRRNLNVPTASDMDEMKKVASAFHGEVIDYLDTNMKMIFVFIPELDNL